MLERGVDVDAVFIGQRRRMILHRYHFGAVFLEDASRDTADVAKTLNHDTGTFDRQVNPFTGFTGSDEHAATGGFVTAE